MRVTRCLLRTTEKSRPAHELQPSDESGRWTAWRRRGRTGGQKPKLGPRQVRLARQMYDELGADGKRRYTVAQIAAKFGVTRPTIYRHLTKTTEVRP
jgi:DNA invertase Pin-like site-specific DNA recombinase